MHLKLCEPHEAIIGVEVECAPSGERKNIPLKKSLTAGIGVQVTHLNSYP